MNEKMILVKYIGRRSGPDVQSYCGIKWVMNPTGLIPRGLLNILNRTDPDSYEVVISDQVIESKKEPEVEVKVSESSPKVVVDDLIKCPYCDKLVKPKGLIIHQKLHCKGKPE